MRRMAFVHIGAPKTGTTSIQSAFSQSSAALHDAGFHYLEGERKHSERLALAFWAPEDAARLASMHSFDDVAFDQAFHRDQLAEELDAHAHRHVIVSADELTELRSDERQAFLGFLEERCDEVHVIAYARELQSWMHSAGQQAIKWSGATLPDLFDRPRLPRYRARFEGYRKAVGPSRFHLRLFGAVDVVADFADAIGVPEGVVPPSIRQNEALSKSSAIVLAAINAQHPPFIECRHNPFRAFGLIKGCTLPGMAFRLPRETITDATMALEDDRDFIHDLLGEAVFPKTELPDTARAAWLDTSFGPLQAFAHSFGEALRSAQNERAMRLYLTALRPEQADHDTLLERAALLATDRWTLGQIAERAVETGHAERAAIFAKQRFMRRIEAPQQGEPPLGHGNPFDRYWRADSVVRVGSSPQELSRASPVCDFERA